MSESAQFPQIGVVLASRPSSPSSAQTLQTMNRGSGTVEQFGDGTESLGQFYGNRLPIFIQILRRIIFRHFVSVYLALIGSQSIFYALYRLSFQSVPFF
jgi:hypothetical protein